MGGKKKRVIMKDGVLPFINADGSISFKLRRMVNFKKFFGKKIPIVDNHPKGPVGNSDAKVFGSAEIIPCDKSDKSICAIINLKDDAPKRAGVSLGYIYQDSNTKGVFEGLEYDTEILPAELDHLALTDIPKDPRLLEHNSAEALGSYYGITNESSGSIDKYYFAYESYIGNKKEGGIENIAQDKEKGVKLTMAEKELMELNAELQSKIAAMEAKLQAQESFEKELSKYSDKINELKTQLEKVEKEKTLAVESLKKIEEDQKKERLEKAKAKVSEMIKTIGKEDIFNGLTPEATDAIYKIYKELMSRIGSGAAVMTEGFEVGGDTTVHLTTDYFYDSKKDEWVLRGSNK